MCPVSVRKSSKTVTQKSNIAQLWALLIGVNHYQDPNLSSLDYSAIDCQELSKALEDVTQDFQQRSILTHHDYAANAPTLAGIRASLKEIANHAKENDQVIFYFSGHGIVEPETQQAVLCLHDTTQQDLLGTGLAISELLQVLGECAAPIQFVCLDACHSGGVPWQATLTNPTSQLIERLQERATRSQGFYALLSCDRAQQSWEFPEIGHGIFTYYLIRGLRGEAANAQGVIEADQLYRYVYHQTLHYIDQINQQLRLINQQKRNRGEPNLQPEYPLQTPKRIVEGVGELILGKSVPTEASRYPRRALIIEANPQNQTSLELGKVLRGMSQFELHYWLPKQMSQTQMQQEIQACLRSTDSDMGTDTGNQTETALLYLKGDVEVDQAGEVYLTVAEETRLSRSWLRQQLHRAKVTQQIIIINCNGTPNLADWIEELKLGTDYGQCLLVASTGNEASERFTQAIIDTLTQADPKTGLAVASWIYQLKAHLAETTIQLDIWLSGGRGVIEVLPAHHQLQTTSPSNLDLGICPYVGLKPFQLEHSAYFYGRQQLTQKLIAELYQRSFLALVGASGSGKSSVVQAGIMAQLQQGKQLPGSEQWRICYFRPGEHPLTSLTQHLVSSQEQQNQLEGLLYQGVEGLVRWLRSYPEPMVVLVVDQFEELFTLANPIERSQFLELLLGAINYARDRVKLIITLRVDFMTHCLDFSELATLLQQASFFVPPNLSEQDYRNVIIKPAESVGLQVESRLVEVLLQEIGTATGKLPLLEFVLEQLWEYRQQGTLTLEAYQQQIGGLEGALEKKANAVYENLDPHARDCAQWIFLALTQVGENIADTSRQISKQDLIVGKYPQALVERTLQELVKANLVVVDSEMTNYGEASRSRGANQISEPEDLSEFPLQTTIEIAHDILIHNWSTLRWWLEQNRNRLQLQRQLEQAARLWQQHHQNSDYLWQGARLAQAEEIYIKETDELSETVQQFIEAGLAQRDAEQRQAQRRLRRAQAAAATISLLGIVAMVVGGLAYWQRQKALINQVETLNASAGALYESEQPLKGLEKSLKAQQQLSNIAFPPKHLPIKIASTLQDLLHRTQARNLLTGHTKAVSAVDVSSDGELIASASWDGTIRLWQSNGKLLTTLKDHQSKVMDVAFHPNGHKLVSASSDGTFKLWDRNGTLLKTTSTEQQLSKIRFSPDGKSLVTAAKDGTITFWDENGNQQEQFVAHEKGVDSIGFSPEGQFLASGSAQSSTVKIWQPDGTLAETLKGYEAGVGDISFSPNGELLAVTGLSGKIKVHNMDDSSQFQLPIQEEPVTSVGFAPDGKTLISGAQAGTINYWALEKNSTSPIKTLTAHQDTVRDVSFFPNPNVMVSASEDQTLRTWQLPQTVKRHQGDIYSIAVDPKRDRAASAGSNHTIQLWTFQGMVNQKPKTVLKGHSKSIKTLSFSSNGDYLASGSADETIKIWHPTQQTTPVQTLKAHNDIVNSVDFSPTGEMLASGSNDGTIRLWHINGELHKTLSAHQGGVSSVDFASHRNHFASGGYDGKIKIWQTDGTLQQVLKAQDSAITAIAFSSDGNLVASAGTDHTIQLWSNGELIKTLAGHRQYITNLSFHPKENILASGSVDETIKLWNRKTGELLASLEGQGKPIRSVRFSSNGKTLIAGGKEGSLKQWQFDLTALREQGCDHLSHYLLTHSDKSLCQN